MNICVCCLDVVKEDIRYFQADHNASMYEKITGLSISAGDKSLRVLCCQCYEYLNSVQVFRQTCVLAHNVLRELTNNVTNDSEDYINNEISEKRFEISALKERYSSNIIVSESDDLRNCKLVLNTGEKNILKNSVKTEFDDENISITKEYDCYTPDDDQNRNIPELNIGNMNVKCIETKKIEASNKNKLNHPASAYIKEERYSRSQILAEMQRIRLTAEFENAPYKCVSCAKVFRTEFLLNDHFVKHSAESGEYSCDICGQRHPILRSLQRHIRGHLCLYVCKICDKTLYEQKAAFMHIQRLHKELLCGNTNPVSCKICSKEFKNEIILQTHVKLHDDTRNFKCCHCTNIYTVKSSLVQHMRTHTGERPYICSHCKASFTRRTALTVHIRTQHKCSTGGNVEEWYRCEPCNKTYASQGKLNEHLKIGARHVRADTYRLSCDRCGQRFLRSRELVSHTSRHHSDEVPRRGYVCHLCGGTYASARSLTEHVMRHKGKTPHQCEHCESQFVTLTLLKEHKANKHARVAGIEFSCSICCEKFPTRKELRRHNTLIHSDETKMKFTCNVCGKQFTRKDSLKIHSALHAGGQKFTCEHCARDFTQLSNLKRHLRSKHVHRIGNNLGIGRKTQDDYEKNAKISSLPKDLMQKIPNFLYAIDPNLQILRNVDLSPNYNTDMMTSNISSYDENTNAAETSAYCSLTDGFNLNLNDWNVLKNTLIFDNPVFPGDFNSIRKDFTNGVAENEIQLNILEGNDLTRGLNSSNSSKDNETNLSTRSMDLNMDENILGIDNLNNILNDSENIAKVSESQGTKGGVTVVVMSTGDGSDIEFTKISPINK